MARSLIATEAGVKRAEEALIDLRINQKVLLQKLQGITSRSTVSNFFARKAIAHENFTEICKILKLEWRDIAEIAEEETMESVISSKTHYTNLAGKQPRLNFVIGGTIDQVDQATLTAIVEFLRQKTGDVSIAIVDIQEGSIKLILTGTPEALEMIQNLYRSGELTEVEGTPMISVDFENLSEADLPRDNTYRYHQVPQESLVQQVSQKTQQSWEPQKNRWKKQKTSVIIVFRDKVTFRNSPVSNKYSAILSLGFTLIKFLFLFIVGFIIAYIFASFTSSVITVTLSNIVVSMPTVLFVVLVSCIMAITTITTITTITIFLKSYRK